MASFHFIVDEPEYGATTIPNIFIDHYMPGAPSSFVMVYLWVFRHVNDASSKKELSSKSIGKALQLLESDVVNAWKYWEQAGLVSIDESADTLSIHFLTFHSKSKRRSKKNTNTAGVGNKPIYSTQEMDLCIARSQEFKELLTFAENALGKLLDYKDISALLSLQDWLMLPVDVIKTLMEHCAKNDHRDIRYIEKVAMDWASKGILTKQAALDYIKSYNVDYFDVLKALGFKNRNPIETEIQYIDKWIHTYLMPIEVILLACTKSVMQTGRGSFAYVDGILSRWDLENIRSLEAVKASDENHSKKAAGPAKNTKAKTVKQNRFVNFEQREWDFKEIEQLEQQHIQQLLDNN